MLICMNTFNTIKSKQQAENYFSEELRQYFDGSNIKGRLMERLGLAKNIPSEKIFTAILNNKHPVTGKKLRPRESKRLLFSFCFSAPKPLSILAMFTDDKRLFDAHRKASNIAGDWLENFAEVRKRKGGRTDSVLTGETLRFSCEHMLSRAEDPQLHSHEVFFNITYDKELNAFYALDPGQMGTRSKLATHIYRNILTRELNKISVPAYIDKSGRVKIYGINDKLCSYYSKRSKEINKYVEDYERAHPGQKCGNRFRAKVANAFKGKKLSIAEENLAIARFKEEIEDANLDEELYRIANIEKGYVDSLWGKLISSLTKRNADKIVSIYEKGISQKRGCINMYDYLMGALICAKAEVSYSEIREAVKKRLNAREISQYKDTIILKSNDAVWKEIVKILPELKNIMLQYPISSSQKAAIKNLPHAKKILADSQPVVEIKESEFGSATGDMAFISKLVVNGGTKAYYLNASRKIKRKKTGAHYAEALKFEKLGSVENGSLIIVDNADYVDNDHMLDLLKTSRDRRCKIILLTCEGLKTDPRLHAIDAVRAQAVKMAPPGPKAIRKDFKDLANAVRDYRVFYGNFKQSGLDMKLVFLSEKSRDAFVKKYAEFYNAELPDYGIYPNINIEDTNYYLFAQDGEDTEEAENNLAKQGLSVHVVKFLAPEHNILPIYANRPIGRYPAAPVQNKTGTLERKYTGINANPQSGKSKSNMPIQKPLARQGLQNIKPNQALNPPILHRPQGNDKLQDLTNAGNRNSPPGDSSHSRPGSAGQAPKARGFPERDHYPPQNTGGATQPPSNAIGRSDSNEIDKPQTQSGKDSRNKAPKNPPPPDDFWDR